MAISKHDRGTLIIVLLAGVLLAALNPTRAEFVAYLSGHRGTEASAGGMMGAIGKGPRLGLGPGLGTAAGSIESGLYRPRSYLLFSTFAVPNGSTYLGVAGMFIKVK